VDKVFQFRGDLQQSSLPEVFFKIHHFAVPGVMEASRQGIEKKIFLRSGNVVHASSSDRADSLGAFLRRTGRLSQEDYSATMRDRAGSEHRYGALLVEKGLFSPAQVFDAIREQIEAILWSLFAWEEGEVAFRISEFPDQEMVRLHLPIRYVIVQGIKRAPSAKALLQRLGNRETVFDPCYRVEELIEIGLDANEYKLLTMVNGKRSLFDICTNGPLAPPDNAKLIYAYQTLNLIRRSESGGAIKIKIKSEGDAVGRPG
jgi:two-component system OmpR family response regulator